MSYLDDIMKNMEHSLKPYKSKTVSYPTIPKVGRHKSEILLEMEKLKSLEENRWKDGFASGTVYNGDADHINFLNKVYSFYSQCNPLHADIWPSMAKFESEIVSMTANMLGGDKVKSDQKVCGVVTSGGTESILLAMKTYRDWAKDKKNITQPEMIIPSTAHAAFDKASQYFNIKAVQIPVTDDFKANVRETEKAITENTIVIVGSAPSYPHGVIDPIEELSELARKNEIYFHTDACLGGFILPWAEKLGYKVPPFDFRLPGVTSISADTHKYGYANKGTSTILYRYRNLLHYQFYKTTEWPGGIYFSPTFAGSRPGALIATCWAAMVSLGEKGYLEATDKILKTALKIKKGIENIPELTILGDPLWNIAFGSEKLDIYKVMDRMTRKKWSLNGLHKPPCIHICVTLRHTLPGVAERFIEDLEASVEYVKNNPEDTGDMAPLYGMAATLPDRQKVKDILDLYLDLYYKI
ncbi:MAG: aminotransferase class V-fold PLP-dependent enzyme [Promethearchaeota archaeon]